MADTAKSYIHTCSCGAVYTVVETMFGGSISRDRNYGYQEGCTYYCSECGSSMNGYRDHKRRDGYRVTYSFQLYEVI